jgi:hypothetical protein
MVQTRCLVSLLVFSPSLFPSSKENNTSLSEHASHVYFPESPLSPSRRLLLLGRQNLSTSFWSDWPIKEDKGILKNFSWDTLVSYPDALSSIYSGDTNHVGALWIKFDPSKGHI